MAPGAGFEPATNWLTANCSTAELPRITMMRKTLLEKYYFLEATKQKTSLPTTCSLRIKRTLPRSVPCAKACGV